MNEEEEAWRIIPHCNHQPPHAQAIKCTGTYSCEHAPTNKYPTNMYAYIHATTYTKMGKQAFISDSIRNYGFSSTSCKAFRTHAGSLSNLHTTSLFCFSHAEVSPLLTKGSLPFAHSGYLCSASPGIKAQLKSPPETGFPDSSFHISFVCFLIS